MIISLTIGTTYSLVAKIGTRKISELFEELQGSNLEFKVITPKPITGTHLETNLSRFGLAGLPMAAILDVGNALFSAVSRSTGLKFGI